MKNRYVIRVYDWNPNGTNDISIVNSSGEHDPRREDTLDEALYGIDINKLGRRYDDSSVVVPIKTALKHIAVSPIENGMRTVRFLRKYFKSIK